MVTAGQLTSHDPHNLLICLGSIYYLIKALTIIHLATVLSPSLSLFLVLCISICLYLSLFQSVSWALILVQSLSVLVCVSVSISVPLGVWKNKMAEDIPKGLHYVLNPNPNYFNRLCAHLLWFCASCCFKREQNNV